MRCGREQDEGVGATREQIGQTVALGTVAFVGNVVGLVDDDEVPPGLFQIMAVFAVALERIDRDDGAVEVVEGIVVGRNVAANALDAGRVQPGERDGEAVPELLLELAHHAFGGHHQDAPRPAPPHQFGGENAGLQCLAQAHCVGNEQARAQALQRPRGGLQLEGHGVHHAVLAHHQRIALHGRLAQPRLDGQPALDEAGRDIEHQFCPGGIEDGDLVQHAQKQRLAVADSFGYTHAGQLPATVFAGIGTLDEPFFVANEDTGAGGRRLGELGGQGRGKSPDERKIMGPAW